MQRVAIYAREDPTGGAAQRLDAQVASVTAVVRCRGGWVVATDTDCCAGATSARPGLRALLAHAGAGWFDVVVVERRERMAPDAALRRQVSDMLSRAGVRAVVLHPPLGARLGRLAAGLALVDLVEGL
jgi:DNA invertase Pin-like site-specific DNA recombinase